MAAYWEITAHSAYVNFLIISTSCQFSFSNPDFRSGNFILIAPFPDHCLLVPFCSRVARVLVSVEAEGEVMAM